MVIWITGLSGVGKTTLGRLVADALRARGEAVLFLDGDEVRAAVRDEHAGYDHRGRLRNAERMSRLAALAERQGLRVVVATMSLFHEIHAWNRGHLAGYFEVYLKADLERLKRRDDKGVYASAAQREVPQIVGLDVSVEEPLAPDLVLQGSELEATPAVLAQRIFEAALLKLAETPG